MKIDLTGKIALVTGSNAGIGRQILETLAASGAKVAVNYLYGSSEETVEAVRQAGGEAYAFQADVTNPAQLDNMVKEIEAQFGGTIDILVNNAGGMVKRVPNTEMDEEHYNKVMDVNFKSCVFACKAVAPGMIAKKAVKSSMYPLSRLMTAEDRALPSMQQAKRRYGLIPRDLPKSSVLTGLM